MKILKKQKKEILKFWILVDQDAYMGALVLALGLGWSLALGLGPSAKAGLGPVPGPWPWPPGQGLGFITWALEVQGPGILQSRRHNCFPKK